MRFSYLLLFLSLWANLPALASPATATLTQKEDPIKQLCLETARYFGNFFGTRKCRNRENPIAAESYNVSPHFNTVYLLNDDQLLMQITDNFTEPKIAYWFLYNYLERNGKILPQAETQALIAKTKQSPTK
jgi:hypothetical protein